MATTKKLAELFRAVASQDFGVAASIAAQVCKDEEQKGHRSAARLLRGALSVNGFAKGVGQGGSGNVTTNGIVSTALVRLTNGRHLSDVVLQSRVRRELDDVLKEWKHRIRLSHLGIRPRSKLLFHGPPGCGKSLTARAMGIELNLPVFLVRFDAVIGAFLGQTASHLRQLFYFAEVTPCIMLLDELDALGKRRGNPLDVGELDRIVIAIMQELEHSVPAGLIIATSNMANHLDDALWRRFDLALEFKEPSRNNKSLFVKRFAKTRGIALPASISREAVESPSFATAESIVLSEARRQALRDC
jgi:AAA+ superfamily predicted ATPase